MPSWSEGGTKSAILEFVQDVTNAESEHFIPVTDRIATFDNDGNLWYQKEYAFINISGLSLGIACCVLIIGFALTELNFDRFHENTDQIYRVVRDSL